uniref:Uncharacterized protein n=1 Tax=Anguilla anguilla TaxID=7936 RepID=A0A0E9XAA7_ANGAN
MNVCLFTHSTLFCWVN